MILIRKYKCSVTRSLKYFFYKLTDFYRKLLITVVFKERFQKLNDSTNYTKKNISIFDSPSLLWFSNLYAVFLNYKVHWLPKYFIYSVPEYCAKRYVQSGPEYCTVFQRIIVQCVLEYCKECSWVLLSVFMNTVKCSEFYKRFYMVFRNTKQGVPVYCTE